MSCENCEESAYVIDKLAKLLAEIAVIVNGPEPPLTSWSYHDLPEKVRALKQAPPAAVAEGVQRHPMYVGMRNRLTSELVRRFELAGNEFARAKAEALVSEYQSALAAALAANKENDNG